MTQTAISMVLLCAVLVFSGCSEVGEGGRPDAMMRPGVRPDPSSDEAGLWMAMDRHEKNLKTSGSIVKDANLNEYVRQVFCRLTPDYCGEIRLYVLARRNFNASMAPNGSMTIWTGMLLRVESEAQLAFVLAHELAHYLRRHSLQTWRAARAALDSVAFLNVAAMLAGSAAGVPALGSATSLAAALIAKGSILSFSRDQEREADALGLEMMANVGYHPGEAVRLWENLTAEKEAGDDSAPLLFFSAHPTSEERMETLRSQAQALMQSSQDYFVRRKEFQTVVLPLRHEWLRQELRQQKFARTEVLLDRLIGIEAGVGELYYFKGELYRLRSGEADAERAIAAYAQAVAAGDAPAETYRSMGIVRQRIGDRAAARRAFVRYLALRPDAADRAMVESYISGME